ncbi:MAG: hypothetical protein SVG88_14440 [Halobacteriales archaeon]|nr:hypothetical protein [Halobacteriales archaeon]
MSMTEEPMQEPPEPSSPSNDEIYSILADRRRRYTIHFLKQREEPVSIRDLAEQVAAWENNKTIQELTSQERKRVYISLYQSHLPSMDKSGLVDYDEQSGMVELGSSLETSDIYIEFVPENDIPWNVFYLGLSAANATILALAWLEVAPFDAVPDLVWGAVVLVTFALSSLAQTLLDSRRKFGQEGPPPGVADND